MNTTDESEACCKVCEKSVSRGGRSTKSYNTSNLCKHVMTKHPEQYMGLQKVEKEQSQTKAEGSKK